MDGWMEDETEAEAEGPDTDRRLTYSALLHQAT